MRPFAYSGLGPGGKFDCANVIVLPSGSTTIPLGPATGASSSGSLRTNCGSPPPGRMRQIAACAAAVTANPVARPNAACAASVTYNPLAGPNASAFGNGGWSPVVREQGTSPDEGPHGFRSGKRA